jgi:predicted signal transduction protein with EAL and GGDEF domain
MESFEELIEAADAALYEAKKTGRDKVCVSSRKDQRLRWSEPCRAAAPKETIGAG